jgi:hypothetical protein
MAIEVEASSFSVWNCVITFLQILLMSTILYGAGWNQGPDSFPEYNHFRAIAFFFGVWALQSVALALLLVFAVGKRSYHLCHSWMLCEILMQFFIGLCGFYFAYHSFFADWETEANDTSLWPSDSATPSPAATAAMAISNGEDYPGTKRIHQVQKSFRPPKHLTFLIVLHFLIKAFGFWIVKRYMRLISNGGAENDIEGPGTDEAGGPPPTRRMSPPPSYDGLCIDELPCYDEALKLCLKNDSIKPETSAITGVANDCNNDKTSCKSPFAPTPTV